MTNPDTSTLNGALEQLGITMADNLVTMGVSDADPSDGLTTLASRILDIGPTPPTPTPASITLTADKSILSYADTESAVLTATVLDSSSNPVEGVSVDLYKDSVLWDTLTTGSAGTVSKTYTSLGAGDVGFTAECGSLVTETYSLCDAWKYDSTEHSESFGTSSVNKTITEYPNSSDYSVEMDVLCTGNYYFTNCSATSNDPSGSKIGYGTSGTGYIFTIPTGSAYGSQITSYYHIKWVKEGNTMKMYLNDGLIDTCTDNAVSTLKYLTISSWGSSKTVYYKNVLIKPL